MLVEDLKKAMDSIEHVLQDSERKELPNFCGFLAKENPQLKISNEITQMDEWQKYCCYKRAVFPIEISYMEATQRTSVENFLKEKMKAANIYPLKNQEEQLINTNGIKEILWLEFLKNMDNKFYRIDWLGLTKGIDSYQFYLSVYYK